MNSLTQVYEQIAGQDEDLHEKTAAMNKQAEEEDAAGRITARGFADELQKLASMDTTRTGPEFGGAGAMYGAGKGMPPKKNTQGLKGKVGVPKQGLSGKVGVPKQGMKDSKRQPKPGEHAEGKPARPNPFAARR